MESGALLSSHARFDELNLSPNGQDAAWEVSVNPSSEISEHSLAGYASWKNVDFVARALAHEVQITGWFVPPQGMELHGIRAKGSRRIFVARRKHLRPEVFAKFPSRPNALTSGFKIDLHLDLGGNHVELQYKDGAGRWTTFGRCYICLPLFWWLWRRFGRRAPSGDYEIWSRKWGDPSPAEYAAMRRHLERFPSRPLISVLLPVYNTPRRWLQCAIESVRAQIYPHWELCIADDHSTDPSIRKLLLRYSRIDSRIKVCFRQENGHICRASNSALELCQGEYVALLDHDDELPPHALYHVAWEVANHPEANVVFSDEDKIDTHDVRSGPYFKPGWNYDLLLGQNCVSHFGVFRASLMRELGGFRPGTEGSQDWDLTLRMVAHGGLSKVRHIPRVLYHWRTLETSTASSSQAKPYAVIAGRGAVENHLKAVSPGTRLKDLDNEQWQVMWPVPEDPPLVSIIIPTKDQVALLRATIESIQNVTTYPNWEIVLLDHDSRDAEARAYIDDLALHNVVRVFKVRGEFNWSRLNNIGAHHARGEVLLFLNNDISVTKSDWLRELVSHALRPDVGAVGARLLYPDQTIQHAGVVLNLSGIAGHVFRNSPPGISSLGGSPDLAREVTAVTGACLAVRKDVFERAGGFDELHLPIAYNDVDFCLRLRALGLRNIYTPFACIIHHESASRALMETTSARKAAASEEARIMLQRWPTEFKGDVFFNQNLSLTCELPVLAVPRRIWPWQAKPQPMSTEAPAPTSQGFAKSEPPFVKSLIPTSH